MFVYVVRCWNLSIVGSIKADCAYDAQAAWEAQALDGKMVLATRSRVSK